MEKYACILLEWEKIFFAKILKVQENEITNIDK